jgi:hypothetical protein
MRCGYGLRISGRLECICSGVKGPAILLRTLLRLNVGAK